MKIGELMTGNPKSVTAHDSLLLATKLLKENGFKHLPVVENGALIGVVSDRDLKRASASDATTLEVHELLYLLDKLKVEQIMVRDVATVEEGDTVESAARLMIDRKVGCLPVVSGGKLTGIVTKGDLIKLLASRNT